jgi:hypothetical protein
MIPRWTILEDDFLHLELEQTIENDEPVFWFHCEVKKWTHGLFKEYVYLMYDIQDIMKKNDIEFLFALVKTKNTEKFARLFGWQFLEKTDLGKIYFMGVQDG